jgi:hypothetical protein
LFFSASGTTALLPVTLGGDTVTATSALAGNGQSTTTAKSRPLRIPMKSQMMLRRKENAQLRFNSE